EQWSPVLTSDTLELFAPLHSPAAIFAAQASFDILPAQVEPSVEEYEACEPSFLSSPQAKAFVAAPRTIMPSTRTLIRLETTMHLRLVDPLIGPRPRTTGAKGRSAFRPGSTALAGRA